MFYLKFTNKKSLLFVQNFTLHHDVTRWLKLRIKTLKQGVKYVQS